MFDCLVKHGCTDLSLLIDPRSYSSSAIATGGFGDIWHATMYNGMLVGIKTLRLHLLLQGDDKAMKVLSL